MLNIFSLFKSRNKTQNKMSSLKDLSLDELQNMLHPMEFQWIKGDFSGSTERYKSVTSDGDNVFIIFKSGRRLNLELLEEFMVFFPAPPEITVQQAAPIQSAKRSSTVTSIVYDSASGGAEDSPIYKLLKKQKKNSVEVGIKLKLNLPPKELFGVLSSSFEDAEKEIINFVLDGVDIEDIKIALADSIKKNYYQLNTKPEKVLTTKTQSVSKKTTEEIDEPIEE